MGLFDRTTEGSGAGRGEGEPHARIGPHATPRVLVVAADASRRAGLDKALQQDHLRCELADSAASAISLLARCQKSKKPAQEIYAAAVIDAEACTPATLKLVRELGARQIAAVILCPSVTFDEAVAVMRAGAADIVSADIKPRELSRRVRAACKASPTAPPRVLAKPIPKGEAPLPVQQASAEQKAVALRVDFKKLISAELDVEALLRHALEFVLARLGPTNAAVFLPGSTGEYQLGAYVNYSCPKETAEVMLDHLANIAAPRLEKTIGVLDLHDASAIQGAIGEGVEWVRGQRAMAFACRQENETLAVFMIFRDQGQPFPAQTPETLAMIRDEFALQLAKVIRIHHRHLPRDKWGRVGDGLDAADEDDLAA
ncbi:MAG: hypothetical protein ACK54T_06425 [bacterium]